MRLKFLALAITGFFSLLYSGMANAGGVDGGGGKVVVCRDSGGSIISAELLDLWEANHLFQYVIVESTLPVKAQVQAAFDRIKNYNDEFSADSMDQMLNNRAAPFLGQATKAQIERLHGIKLTPTDDSYEIAFPSNCPVENVVRWGLGPSGTMITVNEDIFEALSPTAQAALIVHEAFYALSRDSYYATDSRQTRRVVGYIFAGNSLISDLSQMPVSLIKCENKDINARRRSVVRFYNNASGSAQFKMSFDHGRQLIGPWQSRFDLGMSKEAYFEENTCFEPDGIIDHIDLNQLGPIEFDHKGMFTVACINHKKAYYFSEDIMEFSQLSSAQELTCSPATHGSH